MSRGDNVQEILGMIGPFWAKWGLGWVPQSTNFFSATSQRPIFTKFRHKTYFCLPSSNLERFFSKNFHFRVICPKNRKSKVGQTATSLRAGCRS